MQQLIELLNNNQGAAMVLLTAVYVIATVIIVYYNRRSLNEMKNAREAESRPYLFAYLSADPKHSLFYLVLKNNGKTGAEITRLRIDPEIGFIRGANDGSVFDGVVIAPGQSVQTLIPNVDKTIPDTRYLVQLRYKDLYEYASYSEEYALNQQYANDLGSVNTKHSNCTETENALINIAETLDTIKAKTM